MNLGVPVEVVGDCDLGYPREEVDAIRVETEERLVEEGPGVFAVQVSGVDLELFRADGKVVCFNCITSFLLGCITCAEHIPPGDFGHRRGTTFPKLRTSNTLCMQYV